MANDGIVQVPPDSTGARVDGASITVGGLVVFRQRIVIADESASAAFATVTNGALLVAPTAVAISGTATVAGTVNVSATVQVAGSVAISGIASIDGSVQVSGTAVVAFAAPPTINNVSATVNVVVGQGSSNIGGVSLVAGTSNIGFIDSISRTVQVALSGRIGIDNISATSMTRLAGVNDTSSGNQVPVGDSANSALRVNIVAGAAAGVSQVDDTSFSAAAAAFVPIGGMYADSGTGLSLSASHAGAVRMTQFRALHTNLRTDGGAVVEDSANSALRVNIVAGAAAGVSQIDDTSFTARAAAFVPMGGVYVTGGTGISLSVSHAGALRMTEFRAMHVNLRDSAGAEISAANPLSVKVERQSATVAAVLAAGTANIGTINNISATVAAVLGAGTNNIGAVSLAAGTSNIGFINNISATVNVALASRVGIDNISATVTTRAVLYDSLGVERGNATPLNVIIGSASAQIGVVLINSSAAPLLVDSVSRTVQVAVGTPFTINNVSATVVVTTSNPWVVATPSGSHGPKMVILSTSATATLIAAPGAGLNVYVTMIAVTNGGTVNTTAHMGPSVSTSEVTMFMQSAGGGFVMSFDPPWKLPGNEELKGFVNPNSTGDVYFNMNFFVS